LADWSWLSFCEVCNSLRGVFVSVCSTYVVMTLMENAYGVSEEKMAEHDSAIMYYKYRIASAKISLKSRCADLLVFVDLVTTI